MTIVPDPNEVVGYVGVPLTVADLDRLHGPAPRLSKHQLRQHLRWRFLKALASRRRFQNIMVVSLRDAFKETMRPDRDQATSEQAYVTALTNFIENDLRCREQGKAPEWMLEAFHGMVTRDRITLPPTVQNVRYATMDIEVTVTSAGSGEVQIVRGTEPLLSRSVSNAYGAFSAWDDLRSQLRSIIEEMVPDLQKRFEALTEEDFQTNQLAVLNRADDMQELIDFLWDNKIRPGRKKTLLRRLRAIGLERPDKK